MERDDIDRLAAATARLATSTDNLLDEVKRLARAEAQQVVRRSQRRQRALLAASVWATLTAVLLGALLAVTVIDIHTHQGHIDPIEDRLAAIEGLIEQVDATMADGRLPDLDGERFATSHLAPLAAAPEQTEAPARVILYSLGLLGLGVTIAGWTRAHRDLSRDDTRQLGPPPDR